MKLSKEEEIEIVLRKTLEKAWENPSFKGRLIANPLSTIEEFTGESINLKKGTKMAVVDQSDPNTFYFNIPVRTNPDDMELTENDLEKVAGGWLRFFGFGRLTKFLNDDFTGMEGWQNKS